MRAGPLVSEPAGADNERPGKPYATCVMRVPCEDGEPMTVSAIAFNADAMAAFLALSKGDACAIAGRAKLTTWTKDGERATA